MDELDERCWCGEPTTCNGLTGCGCCEHHCRNTPLRRRAQAEIDALSPERRAELAAIAAEFPAVFRGFHYD